ncbi:DNA-processing protein DprA [Tersicoccus sp. MR15.9]|uniref:DNA-processing protein DprA n=1 Tax=Tersicoccus mangrovi TaxID=3121635 RepID=UPI002FE63D03
MSAPPGGAATTHGTGATSAADLARSATSVIDAEDAPTVEEPAAGPPPAVEGPENSGATAIPEGPAADRSGPGGAARPASTSTTQAARLARAAFSRLAEPQDAVAAALIAVAGPVDALQVATGAVRSGPRLEQAVLDELGRDDAGPALVASAVERWSARVRFLAPDRDVAVLARLGGWLLTPEDPDWPAALADLGPEAPLCLWGRGRPPSDLPEVARAVAVVGARDSTAYGDTVSADLAHGLVLAGCTVVSGGAFGIDAQAHRGALAAHSTGDAAHGGGPPERWPGRTSESPAASTPTGGIVDSDTEGHSTMPTVAVMACGVDRFYPAAHESLLRAVMADGCLLAEVPPGSSPTRWRFLQRNRLIAALSAVTVVVEARWRSGALNTAHHAAGLGREVGAVPGSVRSATSAGCHRLLREGGAVCVTDVDDVLELLAPFQVASSPDGAATSTAPDGADPGQADSEQREPRSVPAPVKDARPAAHDGLSAQDLMLFDALPVRTGSTTDRLAAVAGLSEPLVRAGLGRLSLRGLAIATDGAWRKAPSGRR